MINFNQSMTIKSALSSTVSGLLLAIFLAFFSFVMPEPTFRLYLVPSEFILPILDIIASNLTTSVIYLFFPQGGPIAYVAAKLFLSVLFWWFLFAFSTFVFIAWRLNKVQANYTSST